MVFKYLSPVCTKSGKYVHFCYLGSIRTNESQRASNVQKLPQMTFFGSIKMQTNIFTPKVDQIFNNPNESLLKFKFKIYHFWEMTPVFPTLWVWCRKIIEASKTCKILLYFGNWQICPLFISRPNTYEWVSESPFLYKSSRKWLCWVYLDANKKFHSKKLLRTPTKFMLCFLRNDPRLPYVMSSGSSCLK